MTRSLGVFLALLVIMALTPGTVRPASAEGMWADLTDRIVSALPRGPHKALSGRVPAGFVFPLGLRPDLPVIGATWFDLLPGTPQHVHVYFAPTPRTTGAVETLVASLKAAHYVKTAAYGFANAFVEDSGLQQTWCSGDGKGHSVQFGVQDVDGVAALDMQFSASGSGACDSRWRTGSADDVPAPVLGGIRGIDVFPGMRGTENRERSFGAFAVIRTALPAADALAKLAERFTAQRWTARAPVAAGTTLLQHFSRVDGSVRWNALLILQPRDGSATVYDAALDMTPDPLDTAVH